MSKKTHQIEWKISDQPVEYPDAVAAMEERVAQIRAGTAPEMIWCLEHPPLYTAGTSAKTEDLKQANFPVFETGRGGQYTYHGPGQLVVYVMLDLKKRQKEPDIRQYVYQLEQWIIDTLVEFGITGERREGRVGIWVSSPPYPPAGGGEEKAQAFSGGDKKIAAIGVRVRHWVTYHGISININPDLSHYSGIVPCGINDAGVTSLKELGVNISFEGLINHLRKNCVF